MRAQDEFMVEMVLQSHNHPISGLNLIDSRVQYHVPLCSGQVFPGSKNRALLQQVEKYVCNILVECKI